MNTDTFKGQWKQIKGEVKRRWGMLTDDELDQIDGNFDKLVGRIQERYGYQKDQAERELNEFITTYKDPVGPIR